MKQYYSFSDYLKEKFGTKVYKVTIDAGFTCPNRDGTISQDGCIFCDDSGSFSQAHSPYLSIAEQLNTGINNLKNSKFKAKKFLSYFQAYTNTYKPVKELEKIYGASLSHPDVVGISIGTRPDAVDKDKLSLIASYQKDYEVWLEYGLQTIHNETLKYINRGHDYECFEKAYFATKEKGISVCAHVILGLPGESRQQMMQTAQKLAELDVDGVKIHLLCVLENTRLEEIYKNGSLRIMDEDEYVETVCDFLEYLPSKTTIHRIAGNGLKRILVAPKWLSKKFEILNKIDEELALRKSYQGLRFHQSS